jgi:hypothetical protein
MKPVLPLVAAAVLMSGCSLLTKEPSEARQRKLEQDAYLHERGDPLQERAKAIDARARQYENRGYSARDAKAMAIADAWPKPKS